MAILTALRLSGDLLDYDVNKMMTFVGTILGVSWLCLGLRFWSRRINPEVSIGADDWLALSAMPFTMGHATTLWISLSQGLGKHRVDVSKENLIKMLQCLYAGNILFLFSISFSKLSVLVFYCKIFGVRTYSVKAWRWAVYAIFGLTVAWPFAFLGFAAKQCSPTAKYWDESIPGNCTHMYTYFISGTTTSVFIDIAILTVPLLPLWRLQMRHGRKLAVVVVLLLGYGVASTSIGKLIVFFIQAKVYADDESYGLVPAMYWAVAETTLSTVVISLPAIYQFFKRWYQYGSESLFNSKDYSLREQYRNGPCTEEELTEDPWTVGPAGIPMVNIRV